MSTDQNFNEFRQAAIADARHAISIFILLNGGACIAIGSFISSNFRELSYVISDINNIYLIFIIGTIFSGLCAVFAYMTNYAYMIYTIKYDTRTQRLAVSLHVISLIFMSGSIVLFVVGAYKIYNLFDKVSGSVRLS